MSQQETQIKDISHSIGDINFQRPILLDSEKHVKMRMEGDVFSVPYDNKIIYLKVVREPQNHPCHGCFFEDKFCPGYSRQELLGHCAEPRRTDGISVIFQEIPYNEED